MKLSEIAQCLGAEFLGPGDLEIKDVATLEEAEEGELTFADSKNIEKAYKSGASAVIVPKGTPSFGKPLICVENPKLAFAKAISLFTKEEEEVGIHPAASLAPNVYVGEGAYIGAYAVVEECAWIGERVKIHPFVYIGKGVKIEEDTVIYPHVTIYKGCKIGKRVRVHAGAVIGSDGFGYVNEGVQHHKIPHKGIVIVEDDVEIGANTTVDRATTSFTIIGEGTKIDNQVQVAHNVKIGKGCLIVAQVGIGGSAVIEDGVIVAGQVGVAEHVKIGKGSIVAAKSGVTKNIKPHSIVSGFPAIHHAEEKKIKAATKRLPQIIKKLKDLQR
jgi:UDP-3-O-[3-hydroxymyristoyl] glucosamine N-acyltransferase